MTENIIRPMWAVKSTIPNSFRLLSDSRLDIYIASGNNPLLPFMMYTFIEEEAAAALDVH